MKTTIKKEVVSNAKLLLETIEKRLELEKLEKQLKESFKDLMGSEVALNADGILITVSEKSRTSLDEEKLKEVVDLKDFKKVSYYTTMTVKKVG